jgi:hypothetical protein
LVQVQGNLIALWLFYSWIYSKFSSFKLSATQFNLTCHQLIRIPFVPY